MQKPPKTLADYIVVAVSPILIMLLVGSLAYFFIQVLYLGPMVHGIRWLMFWFVLAIVLVSRIGIEQGKWHARVYGAALAVVTWLYLAHTHGNAVWGALLLAISWWCAHHLTVDCTLISEDEDASGEGVLQSLWKRLEKTIDPPKPPLLSPPLSPFDAMVAANLAKRRSRKPARPPGRTVVWFSLAALPLFGFGQLFLPADDPHARRVGFAFLAIYLGAALSLLATTSFLGLRRYLRQRSAEMPTSVALAWMKFGVFLVGGVLLLALILPRPGANYTWKELTYRIEPKPHKASDHALPFNPPGEGEGTPSDMPVERVQKGADSGKPASVSGGNNPRRDSRPQPNSSSNPEQPAQSDGGSGGSGRGGNQGSSGDRGQSTQPGDNKDADDADSAPTQRTIKLKDVTGPATTDDSSGNERPAGGDGSGERNGNRNGNENSGVSAEPAPSQDSRQTKAPPSKPTPKVEKKSSPPEQPPEEERQENPTKSQRQPSQFLAKLLRVLALVALAALLIWFLVRYRKALADMIRAFMDSVREFFRKLFAIRWRRKPKNSESAPAPVPVLEPFATYENPFVTGKDKTWSSDRLLCYTYEAVCAWAKEQQIALRPQETPREFCLRLLGQFSDFGDDLDQFSIYYTHLAFARQLPGEFETESIRRLWQYLDESLAVVEAC